MPGSDPSYVCTRFCRAVCASPTILVWGIFWKPRAGALERELDGGLTRTPRFEGCLHHTVRGPGVVDGVTAAETPPGMEVRVGGELSRYWFAYLLTLSNIELQLRGVFLTSEWHTPWQGLPLLSPAPHLACSRCACRTLPKPPHPECTAPTLMPWCGSSASSCPFQCPLLEKEPT